MNHGLLPSQRHAVAASFAHEGRITRVQRICEAEHLDAIVAVGAGYATWLTDYHRYAGGLSATILGASGGAEVVASAEEAPLVEREGSAERVHVYGEPGFGLDLDPLPRLVEALARVELLRRCTRIGVAGLSPGVLSGAGPAEVVAVDGPLAVVMAVKDRDEAEKIARSYGLCLEAQDAVADGVAEGASELELFTRAHATAQLAAGEPVEFLADLLAGPASAQVSGPVAVAGGRRPRDGEPVLADILVRAGGYWGDTCRTHVRGEAGELGGLGGLLERLRHVLDESVAGCRPGVRASEVYAAMARRVGEELGGSSPMPHHGGHGLGLDPVCSPNLSPHDDTPLEAGMILAVEPGAYVPGRFGMRLENEYLVTPAGGVELHAALASLIEGTNQ